LVTNQYTQVTTTTDQNGMYSIKAEKGNTLKFSLEEYAVLETMVKSTNKNIDVQLVPIVTLELKDTERNEVVYISGPPTLIRGVATNVMPLIRHRVPSPANTESYAKIDDNSFQQVRYKPLSTFSIDVDKASYSNMRRMINNGSKIPKDAI